MNRKPSRIYFSHQVARISAISVAILMLLATGCVEISRSEKSRYGNPLQGYGSGTRQRFEANEIPPPSQKNWFEQLFDW